MSNARIILRNLTANWVGHGANLVVMFFLSPYIVHTLGVTEYGIWQLLTVLTGYMGLLDLGVRASTGRYIILYLGQNKLEKVDETIRTGLGLYSVMSSLILIAGLALGIFFPKIFPSVPVEYHAIVSVLLPILAVNIWISAVRTVLSSVLAAYDRFDLARGSDLIMLAVRTLGTIAALELDTGLVGLTIAIIGCNVVGTLINLRFAGKIHDSLRLWPLMLKKSRLKELYNYGIGAFIVAASVKIIGQTDLVLVGNLIDINSVAIYSVGAMLIYYSDTLIKLVGMTFFPTLQKAVAQNNLKDARFILYRQVQLKLTFGILMYIGYFSFGEKFIFLWMHDPEVFPMTSVTAAAKVMAVLSVAKLFALMGSFSKTILAATGHIGFSAKMTVLEALINLACSISLVIFWNWGLIGIAAGTLGSHLLIQTIILPYYACEKAGINWFRFFTVTGSKAVLTGFSSFFICYAIQKGFEAHTWVGFLIQVGAAVCCYLPITWMLLVSEDDRKRILKWVSLQYQWHS